MRQDLIVRRQRWQGREYWTIKDPLTLKYYRFEAEEFAILSMLDGQTSSDAIRARFEQAFAPQRMNAKQLQRLLLMLHRSHLLIADAPGQGEELAQRERERARKQRWAAAANFLSLRFRGFDPDRLLTGLDRRLGWIFSPPAAIAALGCMLGALALVAAEFEVVQARLPSFESFFAAHNWLWLAVTLCLTKVIHEFGHGMACKRFGGECHEMGVMLLVLTPCLYCNVSDAWMIPSRWRRAAIGAAGMYFELILASLATFLWWFSAPGMLNHLCLNVMFVSSVSTLLFNANPLMRFDGYYILADLVEIPNLRQKSTAIVQRKLAAWFLGLPERSDPFLPVRHRWLFAAYSVASAVYGWLVTLSIFWFLYRVLEPYGLKLLGQTLGVAMVASVVVLPGVRLLRLLFQPAAAKEVNLMRALFSCGALMVIGVAILGVPLPHYITAGFEIKPRDAHSVYIETPGELKTVHRASGKVSAGEPIAQLENLDSRLTAQRLRGQRADVIARIEGIRQLAHVDDRALLELAQAEESLAALDEQIRRLAQDLNKLTLVAPASGVIVPPPARPADSGGRDQLGTWSGRPLQTPNVGAFLPASTLVCQIAEPGKFEAVLVIDEQELDFVAAGQTVDLHLLGLPGERLQGKIRHVAAQNMAAASAQLAARSGGTLATRTDREGFERPLGVVYQASVPFDEPATRIAYGATGTARVHAGYEPLGRRLWRSACRTFRFEM